MKPIQQLILKSLAAKFAEEFTKEDLEFFTAELVGRFPLVADDLVSILQAFIQDRDEGIVGRYEETMQ